MSGDPGQIFPIFTVFIGMLFVSGLYCILVTRNLIRTIIGLELLIKAATLLMIVAGYASGKSALTEAFVITIIVVEVVVAAVGGGIALRVFRHNGNLDVRELTKLRG